jgi:hypothetical protein
MVSGSDFLGGRVGGESVRMFFGTTVEDNSSKEENPSWDSISWM